jgi:hypothetical protein
MRDLLVAAAAASAAKAAHRPAHAESETDDDHVEAPEDSRTLPALIQITYCSGAGHASCRVVAVQRVWRAGRVIYMQGVCQLRHAVRTFRVDRISELICLATGEVSADARGWLLEHAVLNAVPESDYTPHAVRRRRDELAVLAFVGRSDGALDPDEVEVAIDLVMMSTEKQIDRRRAALYIRRLTPTAIDLEEAVGRVALDGLRWLALQRALRRLVDADRVWPVEEQLAASQIEDWAADARARFDDGLTGGSISKWRREIGALLVA